MTYTPERKRALLKLINEHGQIYPPPLKLRLTLWQRIVRRFNWLMDHLDQMLVGDPDD